MSLTTDAVELVSELNNCLLNQYNSPVKKQRTLSVVRLVRWIAQISWSKDGQQIKSGQQYQVEMAADRGNFWTRLTIYDVQPTQSGQFSVTAVNGFGNVTSSSTLTVRGRPGLKLLCIFFV